MFDESSRLRSGKRPGQIDVFPFSGRYLHTVQGCPHSLVISPALVAFCPHRCDFGNENPCVECCELVESRDLPVGSKNTADRKILKKRNLRLTRFSHLRCLISSDGTRHWPVSESHTPFLLQPWQILLTCFCGLVDERQPCDEYATSAEVRIRTDR